MVLGGKEEAQRSWKGISTTLLKNQNSPNGGAYSPSGPGSFYLLRASL